MPGEASPVVNPTAPAAPADAPDTGAGAESIESDLADGEGGEESAPKASAPVKQKVKLKTKAKDGTEAEEEFDEDAISEWRSTHEQRQNHLRAANKKFEEAKALHDKEIAPLKARLAALKDDPLAFFDLAREQGLDPTELASKYAEKVLAEHAMTPEQRALAQQQQQFQKREAEVRAREEKIEAEHYQREVATFREQISKALPPVLEKHDLPDDEISAGEIGKYVAMQLRAGQEPDLDSAAELYAEHVNTQITRHLDRLSKTPGALAKKYPEIAKRLREEDVASVTSPRPVRPVGKQAAPPPQQKRQKTWAEEEAEERRALYGFRK